MRLEYPGAIYHVVNRWRSSLVFLLGIGLNLFTQTAHAASTTLIASNFIWRYLDDGSNQGTAWRSAAFDDSGWASGAAPLGHGLTGIATTQTTARITQFHHQCKSSVLIFVN